MSKQESDTGWIIKEQRRSKSDGAWRHGENFGLFSKHNRKPLKGFKQGTDTNWLTLVKASS